MKTYNWHDYFLKKFPTKIKKELKFIRFLLVKANLVLRS